MALSTFHWYRLTFYDSVISFDIPHEKTIEDQNAATCPVLYQTAISTALNQKSGLVEIMKNLENKRVITHVSMVAHSEFFGPGTIRCSYVFPNEVFIPTRHTLDHGLVNYTKENALVAYKGLDFIANVMLKIGTAEVSPGDIKMLRGAKPNSFVGFMDDGKAIVPKKPI
ncbi:matrix protein [Cabbage cytorhabdovirus 1]|uniref:Matrix protein n=1 Tax=Cabbage cytorhabdovirus 1 TaxID=2051550 RepID=A0A2D2PYM8_9RHAB|nr:matrix protein [Cabbage cytorhabdovirus 1]ATS17311.1 matrix protein [Cabbage cytorhabdovirus 1]